MICLTTLRPNGSAPADTPPTAGINVMNEFVAAVSKVPGAGNVRWFIGNGGFVIIGEPDSYAVADKILADPAVQVAGAKVFGLGLNIAEDIYLLEAQKVLPFLPQQ